MAQDMDTATRDKPKNLLLRDSDYVLTAIDKSEVI
jgi:hypothetical protein